MCSSHRWRWKKPPTMVVKSGPQTRFQYDRSNLLKIGAKKIDETQRLRHTLAICIFVSVYLGVEAKHQSWSCDQASGPIRWVGLIPCKPGFVSRTLRIILLSCSPLSPTQLSSAVFSCCSHHHALIVKMQVCTHLWCSCWPWIDASHSSLAPLVWEPSLTVRHFSVKVTPRRCWHSKAANWSPRGPGSWSEWCSAWPGWDDFGCGISGATFVAPFGPAGERTDAIILKWEAHKLTY